MALAVLIVESIDMGTVAIIERERSEIFLVKIYWIFMRSSQSIRLIKHDFKQQNVMMILVTDCSSQAKIGTADLRSLAL
ncbi:hypothetical protein V2H45_08390 [Tumidithrix elongata RA019]|uniref:Uncharacterized protein n=1 Tax=Tumidithrix elongata BACA0141 TaxID=2716417 RepID=A0AAW9PVB1_9CYAN|nr:hypothetical protein [Tumidithrix elongata RA019]